MKNLKFITFSLITLLFFIFLTACSVNKYNAVLYSQANEWIDESFLKNNRVKAYYLNKNYEEGKSDPNDKYIYDSTLPSSRIFIITEKNEYNEIFTNTQLSVNFKTEMIILYIFSDVNPSREYKLKKISSDGGILTIETKLEHSDSDDATLPYQRCFVIKMNKSNIDEVIFK